MPPVALTTGELPDEFLLVAALEAEARDVGPAVNLAIADDDQVGPARDLVEHGRLSREQVARLIDVGELDGRADSQ